jgi:hypothetical protein
LASKPGDITPRAACPGPVAVEVDLGIFPLGQGRDGAEVESLAELARDLGRAEDGRPVGHVDETGPGHAALRRASDPAAVEELRVGPAVRLVDVEPARPEIEDARALDEERPLFRIVGFLVTDIDDRRVHLDLAEIGVDRGVEGQVTLQPGLEVEAGVAAEIVPRPERIPRLGRARRSPAGGVGVGLDTAAAVDIPDAGAPSCGSVWLKPPYPGVCQASSTSRPSIFMGPRARTAVIVFPAVG